MLQPIVPPREPVIAPELLQAATALLDEHTRSLLDVRRAEQQQVTAGLVIKFFSGIGVEDSSIGQNMIARVSSLQPQYRDYANQLLSGLVEVLYTNHPKPIHTTQVEANTESNQTDVANLENTLDTPLVGEDLEENVISTEQPSIDVLSEDGSQPEEGASSEEFFQELYPNKVELFEPSALNSMIMRLVGEMIGINLKERNLNEKEFQVVCLLVRDRLANTKLPQMGKVRLSKWLDAFEKLVGLFSPLLTQVQLAEQYGSSGPAINKGFSSLRRKFANTISEGDAYSLVILAKEIAASSKNVTFKKSNPRPAEAIVKNTLQSRTAIPTSVQRQPEQDSDVPKLLRHTETPVGLKNFLRLVFPEEMYERIKALQPLNAAKLGQELYIRYTEIQDNNITEESKRNRLLIIARTTGLYEKPQDIDLVALQRNRTAHQIEDQILRSANAIRKSFELKDLEELLNAHSS